MLNLLNYTDHPSRIGYVVFRFYEKERSDYFQLLLKQENINFEFSFEEEKGLYLYGVRKGDFNKTAQINYLVSAKFRNKIIPNFYFRWGIILFVGMVMLFAFLSAFFKT